MVALNMVHMKCITGSQFQLLFLSYFPLSIAFEWKLVHTSHAFTCVQDTVNHRKRLRLLLLTKLQSANLVRTTGSLSLRNMIVCARGATICCSDQSSDATNHNHKTKTVCRNTKSRAGYHVVTYCAKKLKEMGTSTMKGTSDGKKIIYDEDVSARQQ